MNRCYDPACNDGPTEAEPMPRWADSPSLLCKRCGSLLEQRLAELPARTDALRAVLGGLTASQRGENRPTKGTPPVPLNLAAHDHLEAVNAVLVSWVQMVAEERGLRGPDRNGTAVLTGWLLSQLPWLLEHGAVGDLAQEVRDLTHIADGITRANPLRHRLPAPCPLLGCGGEMYREDGADHVACAHCGSVWTEDQYPWMVRLALDSSGGSITAKEAAERLGCTVGHVRNLVTAGEVRKLGTVDGIARYSTKDIDKHRKEAS